MSAREYEAQSALKYKRIDINLHYNTSSNTLRQAYPTESLSTLIYVLALQQAPSTKSRITL